MKLASRTQVTASKKASKYDLVVSFRARVSAGRRQPGGSVLFADASMQSFLALEPLHKGIATLSTAALAPGPRQIIAIYLGNSKFRQSHSGPVKVNVAAADDDAVAYQVDPIDDGI